MYIDSHVHLDGVSDRAGLPDVLQRAAAAGVDRCVAIGGTDEGNAYALEAAQSFPDRVRAAMGYDRDCAGSGYNLDALEQLLAAGPPVAAIGETGLDYHYSADTAAEQRRLFEDMCAIAGKHELPLVIHSRDAEADTLALLENHRSGWRGAADRLGVLHCFTGDATFAEQLVALDLYISFSGIVTFKNADVLRAVARIVPDDRLLIETDAPYLAPVPYRGKPNEPAYVPYVAAAVADARQVSTDDVRDMTRRNAQRLFGWH